tara:strand:+ start:961 stop:2100 length:1140 start_codon:yes stop_codon:yes gene_type:complete
MQPNEKIQLDDITFDDVIGGGGVSTTPEIEEPLEPQEEQELEELEDLEEDESNEELAIESDEDEEYEEDEEDNEEEYEEQEEEEEENDEDLNPNDFEDDSVISEIMDKLGYDVENANYEDTPEGIAELTSDIASQIADDRIDEVMEAFPLVKEHLDYVLAGGDSQRFMEANDPNRDYNLLEIDENDTGIQKQLLSSYFATKGHDKEFIEEMVNDFEDTGKLYSKAEAAKTALSNLQEAQRSQMVEEQRQQQAVQEEKLTEFWNGVADTIEESAEFAGISVPDRDKNKFFDYLSTPVTQEGQTQRDIDHQDADMDIKLAIDYLMYKGFDLGGLVETKAKTQNARSLKDRISRNEESVKSTRRSSRRKGGNVDLENLDLSL